MCRSALTIPCHAGLRLFVLNACSHDIGEMGQMRTEQLRNPRVAVTNVANQKGKHRKRSPRLKSTSERERLNEMERRRIEKREELKAETVLYSPSRLSPKRRAFHYEAGFLTCRSLPFAAFPFPKEQWHSLRKTCCLQWRDRAGFTPASLFICC